MDFFALANKLGTLNENTYYGKNPSTIRLEGYFDQLIDVFKKKQFNKVYKIIPLIESEFENLFNFKSVYIEPHMVSVIEAYTYPVFVSSYIDSFNDSPFDVEITKSGPRMKSKKLAPSVHIVYSYAVIVETGLTGVELLAITLHEIGHSFDRRYAKIINNIIMHGLYKNANENQKITDRGDKEVKDFRKKYTNDKTFHKELRKQFEESKKNNKVDQKQIDDGLNNIIGRLFDSTLLTLLAPYFFLISTLETGSYINKMDTEKFADSFATAYGYGPELSEGLRKLEVKINYNLQKAEAQLTPFAKFFYVYNILVMEIAIGNLKTHPSTFKRIEHMANYLLVCIEAEQNPKIKKEMITQYEEIQIVYEKMVENDLIIKEDVRKKISDLMKKIFGVSDIADILSDFRNKYYRGLEEEK